MDGREILAARMRASAFGELIAALAHEPLAFGYKGGIPVDGFDYRHLFEADLPTGAVLSMLVGAERGSTDRFYVMSDSTIDSEFWLDAACRMGGNPFGPSEPGSRADMFVSTAVMTFALRAGEKARRVMGDFTLEAGVDYARPGRGSGPMIDASRLATPSAASEEETAGPRR